MFSRFNNIFKKRIKILFLMTTALKILTDEHKIILKVIDALTKECEALSMGGSPDREFFRKAIEFIKGYADKFHHAKEEDILFVEMCNNEENMHCNPTGQMRHEHDVGRNFIRGLEKGVVDSNKKMIIENASGYANLLKEHIMKEDNILYPMADGSLEQDTKKSMLEKFVRIDKEMSKEMDKHLAFAKEAEKRK
jgi:hemerythrin-like domain-containing protein